MFRGWETILSLIVAALAGVLAPANFLSSVVSEIVAVIAAIMAALVPAMILAATALRAGNFSQLSLQQLSLALGRQIDVFGGLFIYGLLTCGFLVFGKIIDWQGPAFKPSWGYPASVSVGWGMMIIAVFGACLLFCRSVAVILGIRSILSLQTKLALAEAEMRQREASEYSALQGYSSPEGYGGMTELPH